MRKLLKLNKGFTLVELMIVITVIAILATIAVVAFTRVQKQARDTKRKGEMHSIVTALQAYFSEKGVYPVETTVGGAVATAALAGLATTYLPVVPIAPVGNSGANTAGYMYISDANGTEFNVCNTLEIPVGTDTTSMWMVGTSNMSGLAVTDAACPDPTTP